MHWKILRRLLPASGFRRWTRAPIDVKSTTASNRICWLGDTHRHGATTDQYLSPSVRVPLRTMDGGAAAAGAAGAAVAVAAAGAVAASSSISAMDRLLTNGHSVHETNWLFSAPHFHSFR